MRPTDERPPPERRERATQEQAENGNCTLLRHPAAPRQPTETARLLIGAAYLGVELQTLHVDARGRCFRHQRDAWRTEDPEAAAASYRIISERLPVEVRFTPMGRKEGRGYEFALELAKRGIDVLREPLHEQACEFNWVDHRDWSDLADRLSTFKLPVV